MILVQDDGWNPAPPGMYKTYKTLQINTNNGINTTLSTGAWFQPSTVCQSQVTSIFADDVTFQLSARSHESFVDVQVDLVAICIVCIAKGIGRFDHWYTCHCLIILLMEEILHQLGCIKSCKYWDKHYQPQLVLAGFFPSTVYRLYTRRIQVRFFFENWMTQRSNPTARKNPDGIGFSKFSGRDSAGFLGIGV